LCDDLNRPVYLGWQVIFGFAGDELDKIADNYDNMQGWVSDAGLNMAIVSPANPNPHIPTLDELLGGQLAESEEGHRNGRKPARRNPKYKMIDATLKEIAESRPSTQEEVFQSLDGRHVVIPPAEPFKAAHGWIAGFHGDAAAARAWLSKRWAELNLPPLPRGPKNPKK